MCYCYRKNKLDKRASFMIFLFIYLFIYLFLSYVEYPDQLACILTNPTSSKFQDLYYYTC